MENTVKDFLLKKFPPTVSNKQTAYNDSSIWNEVDFDKAQQLSEQVIELFKSEDMTYTDAYAMLGFIRLDLDYRSERMKM